MKSILNIFLIVLSINIYAQDFNSKPFTSAENWAKKNLNQSEIKKIIPQEYELVSEDEKMLIFEKQVSSKIYDLKVLYNNGKISSIIFNLHYDKVWNLMGEISELNYKVMNNGFKNGAIESESYDSQTKPFILVWVTDDNKRTVTGYVNRK